MPEARPLRWLELLIVAAVCAFTFFYGLAHFGLVGADEPRYAQIAREMLERHDWVTPTLYGKAWLEKPVLYYWSAIISYKIFSVSDWAARFPTAVFATAMVFGVYAFGRRFWPGAQLNAALITSTCAGVIGFGRAASTDMPLTASLTTGMLAWITWQQTSEKRWLAAFYAFAGVGMLAKGPVAPFLAALVIVMFSAVRRDARLIVRTLWIPGIAIFIAVALPWYVAVEHSTHEFFRVFILKHNLARYETDVFQHHQPFWYYLAVLPIALLPWTIFAVAGFVRAVRDRKNDVTLLLSIWAAAPVIFFSFSGSKLPGYILPALPAWALLAAWYIETARETPLRLKLAIPHSIIIGALFGVALLSSYGILKMRPTASAWMIGGIGAAAIFAVALLAVGAHGWRALRLATLAPLLIALVFLLRYVAPAINAMQSARPVAETLTQRTRRRGGDVPLVAHKLRRELVYGLGFYRHKPVLVPATNPPPAPDFAYIDAIPETDFVYVTGPEMSDLHIPDDRNARLIGGYAPQRVRFILVPAAPQMSAPDTQR